MNKSLTKNLTIKYFFVFLILIASCSEKEIEKKIVAENSATEAKPVFNPDYIYKHRNSVDEYFKSSDSPLSEELKLNFTGLRYYIPGSTYLIKTKLHAFQNPDTVVILTTKADKRNMLRYGKFIFKVKDTACTLVAYMALPIGTYNSLFVPFKDITCEKESYSGGRYLDLEIIQGTEDYILDFNLAYNPYCAYNKKYSCPLVPDNNFLNVEISAGEKVYINDH